MAEIVLSTLNAKFIHAAFGLRCLLANLGPLRARAALAEFDIHQRPLDIVEALLGHRPRVVGFGVYIWNVSETTAVVAALKRLRPEVTVVLGGPEVSFETDSQPIAALADFVVTGEADLAFAELCGQVLEGRPPASKILPAPLPDLARLAPPYEHYSDADLAHRVTYVEASRGCPFACEFCLSSLDVPVRQFPLEAFLAAVDRLLARGATQLKFVDRTFNLHPPTARAILEFLRERWQPGRLFHFELVPDRLPEALRSIIVRFPPGALQFEVGVQTFNADVAARISRRQDYVRLEENLRWLREHTGVHLHTDLIFGLPGESLESFGAGFDRLVALRPQEIQVGILKRLRGTPIVRHDAEWGVVWNPQPPYEMLENWLVDFPTLQRMRRFARYWDLVANSGNFVRTTPLLWRGGGAPGGGGAPWRGAPQPGRATGLLETATPFSAFLRWSDWLFARVGRTDGIALARLMELLFAFLTGEAGLPAGEVAQALAEDYQSGGRRDTPSFLLPHLPALRATAPRGPRLRRAARRQDRHLAQPPQPPA